MLSKYHALKVLVPRRVHVATGNGSHPDKLYLLVMPLNPRARSASTIANDWKILSASVDEAYKNGLHHLRFGPVVERTGLTTGALYSRCVDRNDLMASLWVERLCQPTINLLTEASTILVSDQSSDEAQNLARRLSTLSKVEWVGLEAIIIARRIPELDEVLTDDIAKLLDSLGINSPDPLTRLRVVVAFSTIIGCILNSYVDKNVDEWVTILTLYATAMHNMTQMKDQPSKSQASPPVLSSTGDRRRDALIDATADVIARSGFDGATLARISRKARLTSGAVYTSYSTKDELIADALKELLACAPSDITSVFHSQLLGGSTIKAASNVYSRACDLESRMWRLFRLEVYLAARTDPITRSLLKKSFKTRLSSYHELFDTQPQASASMTRLIGRVGQSNPVGLTLLELFVPRLSEMNIAPFVDALTRMVYP